MPKKFLHEEVADKTEETFGFSQERANQEFRQLFSKQAKEFSQTVVDAIEKDYRTREIEADSGISAEQLYKDRSWVGLFPYLLPPKRNNHDLSAGYMFLRLSDTGENIYKVAPTLSEAFMHTDFDLHFADVRFPVNTAIVYFGPTENIELMPGCPVYYVFYDKVDIADNTSQIRIILGYRDEDGDGANRSLSVFTFGHDTRITTHELDKEIGAARFSPLSLVEFKEEDKRASRIQYQLLFNFLLYLNNVDRGETVPPSEEVRRLRNLSNPKKRRRLERQIKDQSRYTYVYVGRSYADRRDNLQGQGTGTRLDHRVIVNGHWRKQWYGRRTDEYGNPRPGEKQEIIWIEPFVKGKDKPESDKKTVRVVK